MKFCIDFQGKTWKAKINYLENHCQAKKKNIWKSCTVKLLYF